VRSKSAWALGKIRDRQAVDSLVPLLKDDKIFVRTSTAWALGEIKDKKAVCPLIEARFNRKNESFNASAKFEEYRHDTSIRGEDYYNAIKAEADESYNEITIINKAIERITGTYFSDDILMWKMWWLFNKHKYC
jgi:hypothetical protein